MIRRHLRPAFGTMKVREIGVEDVDHYVNQKIDGEELSEKTVSNHVTLLGTMLRLATTFKVPWLAMVPRFRKPKVALFSRDYQWLRNDEEIRRFLDAAKAEGEQVFVFYALALYSGMRAGELAALEWPDVDLDRRIIAVQRSFNGPTKSNHVRYVPILDPLMPLLRHWRLRHPGRLLFTNADGRMYAPTSSERGRCNHVPKSRERQNRERDRDSQNRRGSSSTAGRPPTREDFACGHGALAPRGHEQVRRSEALAVEGRPAVRLRPEHSVQSPGRARKGEARPRCEAPWGQGAGAAGDAGDGLSRPSRAEPCARC